MGVVSHLPQAVGRAECPPGLLQSEGPTVRGTAWVRSVAGGACAGGSLQAPQSPDPDASSFLPHSCSFCRRFREQASEAGKK